MLLRPELLTQEIWANSFNHLSLIIGVDKPLDTQRNLQIYAHPDYLNHQYNKYAKEKEHAYNNYNIS